MLPTTPTAAAATISGRSRSRPSAAIASGTSTGNRYTSGATRVTSSRCTAAK